jgi:hypothetical protein
LHTLLWFLLGLKLWLPFGPCLLLLPIWSLLLFWKDMWFDVWTRRHSLLLWFLILLLLFFNNFAACWGLTLPFIVDYFCIFYLFNKVSFSSSLSNWDIRTILLVVLIFGSFYFLGKISTRLKGFLFFMNLSLKVSFFLFSSCGCLVFFFFSCGYILFIRNHF